MDAKKLNRVLIAVSLVVITGSLLVIYSELGTTALLLTHMEEVYNTNDQRVTRIEKALGLGSTPTLQPTATPEPTASLTPFPTMTPTAVPPTATPTPVRIGIFCYCEKTVKAGRVVLWSGWLASTENQVKDFLGSHKASFWIDGRPVDNLQKYWGPATEIESNDAGKKTPAFVSWWEYPILLSRGTHLIELEWIFQKDLTDGMINVETGKVFDYHKGDMMKGWVKIKAQ